MANRTWKSFLADSLEKESAHCISLRYEGKDDVPISACTLVNAAFIEKELQEGARSIAIGICDYSREALAHSIGLSIEDALCGRNRLERSFDDWSEGDILSLCGFNFEFKGFRENPGIGKCIAYVEKSCTTQRGLNRIKGKIQKCRAGIEPTKKRGRKLQDGINAYDVLSDNAKILHDSISTVDRPIILATSQSPFHNVPPTKLNKATAIIDGEELPLNDCIKLSHISSDESVKEFCSYGYDGNPSMISICRNEEGIADLYYALSYIEEHEGDGAPRAVVVEAPEPEVLDGMFGHLEDIIEAKIPVIVFCDERTMRDAAKTLDQLGFRKLLWTRESMADLESVASSTPWRLTRREECFANGTVRLEPVKNAGDFPRIAEVLFAISDNRARMSDRGQQALTNLVRLLSDALKQTEMATEEIAFKRISQLDSSLKVLNDPASDSSLSIDNLKDLNEAAALLRTALQADNQLPKEDVSYYKLRDSLDKGKRVCLVSSNQISAADSEQYWKSLFCDEGYDPSFIRAVTPRQFLKQNCTPDDEDVFISGWFSREMMEKIVESGLSRIYSLLLYKGGGVELETNWYLSSSNYWRRFRKDLIGQSRSSLSSIDIGDDETYMAACAGLGQSEKEKDTSPSKLVESMQEDRAVQEKPSDGEEAHRARAVYFMDGSHRWLRIPDASRDSSRDGDTLIVIECFGPGEASYTRRTAAALHQGDIVLKTEADDDALDTLCRQEFGSYEEALKVAQLWRKPIDEAKQKIGERAIKERILRAGSSKKEQTILSWIRGKTSIAPRSKKDISIISKAFGNYFTDDEITQIAKAARMVKGKRITSGKKLTTEIADKFVADAVKGTIEEAARDFDRKHGLGSVELLVVDYVGGSQLVSLSRFGRYIN